MNESHKTLKYNSVDQVSNILNVFQADDKNAAVIFLLPALGIKAKFYDDFCTELSKQNIHVVTTDLRGNGNSSIRPKKGVDFGYKEILENDIPKALEETRRIFPKQELFLAGHSLGGQLFSLYASSQNLKIKGLVFLASCSVHYKGWSGLGKVKTLLGTQFIGRLSQVLGYFPGKKIGFGGTEAKTLMSDWSRHARTGIYRINGSDVNFEEKLNAYETNILAINFKDDDLCPEQATENLIHKFSASTKVDRHLLIGREKKLNHFNWVKYHSEVIPLIVDFVG